jgi:uncharacterized protein (TIGR02996 family)
MDLALKAEFEKVLKADPYDRVARLAFSDFLLENGLDSEGYEEARKATEEWISAYRYLEGIAFIAGGTATNYGESTESVYDSEVGYEIPTEYRGITVEDLLKAGYDYLSSNGEEYFTQVGSETLRNIFEETKNAEEFWLNWSTVTGEWPDPRDIRSKWSNRVEAPFSCSC